MAKAHRSSLRWKKSNSIVTYVLPNSEVQPEMVGEGINPPEFVYVHRVHEAFVRHIFGDSEIVSLQRILTGKSITQYESWKAPHLPPVDRHTKYVFKTQSQVSAPLYVCAPVQLSLEIKRDASANVGVKTIAAAHGGFGRSRTFNLQVSAPVDPYVRYEVTTPHQEGSQGDVYSLILEYVAGLGSDSELHPSEIQYQIYDRFGDYIKGTGVIRVEIDDGKKQDDWRLVPEGRSVDVPLTFYPAHPGKMLLVVAALDQLGNRVFTDFVGLSYDAESDTISQDF